MKNQFQTVVTGKSSFASSRAVGISVLMASFVSVFMGIGLFLSGLNQSWANEAANPVAPFTRSFPNCMDAGQKLALDNKRVLQFKSETPNQYLARGFIAGVITRLFEGNRGHITFELQIGNNPNDTIEVIFNDQFGNMNPQPGMNATICGDYITSNAATNRYPASPSNAIIHWVHENPDNQGHEHGFVELNGLVYGQVTKEVLEYPHFPRFKQSRGVRPLFLFGDALNADNEQVIFSKAL